MAKPQSELYILLFNSEMKKKSLKYLFIFIFPVYLVAENHDFNDVLLRGNSELMNMKIESSYFSDQAFLIETTGARFEYVKDELKLYQGLDKNNRRLLSTITFENKPNFKKVEDNNDHIIFSSKDLNVGIYGDSTLIISPKINQKVKCKGNFKPDYEGKFKGELLLIDEKGGMEIYPQRYEAGYEITKLELGKLYWIADYQLKAGERVMIAVFPGKKFNWNASFNTRIIITHGAMGLGEGNLYGEMPSNSTIENWAQNFNILVLFYKGLYERPKKDVKNLRSHGPYIIENDREFCRMLKMAHESGMKVVTYASLFSYYRKFKLTEPFYMQIKSIKDKFSIDGVYIDGLIFDYFGSKTDNKLANWEMIRRLRELFGRDGVIILHGTHGAQYGNPVATAPNIDSYCTATLNGEGVAFNSTNSDYINYQVRKYGISNTIGMWRSDGKHPKEIGYKQIIDALIEMNGRDHAYAYVPLYDPPGAKGYQWGNGMNARYKYYLDKIEIVKKNYYQKNK